MNGDFAQLICLTTYGNMYLLGDRKRSPPDLVKTNETFQFTRSAEFLEMRGKGRKFRGFTVGDSTKQWFEYLARRGVTRLHLARIVFKPQRPYLPDHVAVAFAGAGNWTLVSSSPNDVRFWTCNPEVIEAYTRQQPRIWEETYKGWPLEIGPQLVSVDIDKAMDPFRTALRKIRSFARRHVPREGWHVAFTKALDALDGPSPRNHLVGDMVPPGWCSPKARRLLVAVQYSWVFGGMCSWNDLNVNMMATKEYKQVTSALFDTMLDAAIAAANEGPSENASKDEQLIGPIRRSRSRAH